MTVKHFLRRILALIILVCLPACMVLAASESYIQTLTGKIKQGDSCVVIDDKFLHLPLNEWNKLQHLSVDNIISFELRFDTSIYFYNKPFTCTLNVSVKYYTSHDQTTPDEINNVNLVVKYDTAKGAFYPADAHYKFKNAFKVVVVVNSITSQEWGNDIPAIFRLKNQILVERKYPFDPNVNGALSIALQNGEQATGNQLMRAFSVSTNVVAQSNNSQLFISWLPTVFGNPEEYDIEWTFIDALSANGDLIKNTYGDGTTLPKEKAEEWMKNDNTRVTVTSSSYTINLPYPDGYILVRVRGVSYQVGTNLRLLGNWDYIDDGTGYAVCKPVIAHEPGLNYQYTAAFAEEGKRKEVISYFDATLRSRQMVTLNNSDKTLVPNTTTGERQETAIVKETIYDKMGRPTIEVLPAPYRSKSLGYTAFNKNTNGQPFNHNNIHLTSNCIPSADPMQNSAGASQYYSPLNPFLGDDQFYFTKYVPDAEQYPYSFTEYMPDNTGRIRRQSGVGKTLRIDNDHATQYFYGKPSQKELDRLFGTEVGDCSHYLKNMVIDPNGQASVSYIDANGKTIATGLAGESPTTVDVLPSKPASQDLETITQQLMGATDFRRDAAAGLMKATSTYMATEGGLHSIKYTVNPAALVTTHSQGQFCSNCYYDVLVEVHDDCGTLITSKTSKPFAINDVTCNSGASAVTNNLDVTLPKKGAYHITYTLQLSRDVINYQTENYITNNSDLKKLQNFFEERLKEIDLAGCYSSCESCKTLGTRDEFRQKVSNLLLTDKFTGVQFSNKINDWINETWDVLSARCNSMSCGVTSACEDYLMQMKADVRPGGQYALVTYDEQKGTYTYDERNINILRYYNFDYWTNREIYNFFFFDKDGNIIYTRDLSESDFIKAYIDHPEWADIFVKKHIEYCGYEFCKDQTYAYPIRNNEVSYNFDRTLREKINTVEEAMAGGYYDPANMYALADADPFFNGGRGTGFKSSIEFDLDNISDLLGFVVKDGNNVTQSVKNIFSFIDWMLYCKPATTDLNALLSSWNGCSVNNTCRSKTLEWEMYRNYYLQLKSKYVARVKAELMPTCTNCFVGQDAVAMTEKVTMGTTLGRHGYIYGIVFQNGNAPFPYEYNVGYQYTKDGNVYSFNTTVPKGAIKWDVYDEYKGQVSNVRVTTAVARNAPNIVTCNIENTDPGPCPVMSDFYVEKVTIGTDVKSYTPPPVILSDGSVFVIDPFLVNLAGVWNSFFVENYFFVHNGGPITRPVSFLVKARRDNDGGGSGPGSNPERTFWVHMQPGQDRVLLGVDQLAFATGHNNSGSSFWVDHSVIGMVCPPYYIPPPSTCSGNPLYADYINKMRVFSDYVNVEGYIKCKKDNPQTTPTDAEVLETFRAQAITDPNEQINAWYQQLKGVRDSEGAFSSITDDQIWQLSSALYSIVNTNIQQATSIETIRPASNFPGAAPSGVYSSFSAAFNAIIGSALVQQGFSEDLLERPYPYNRTPVDINSSTNVVSTDICANLSLLKNRFNASGFSGSFYDYLKQELAEDMLLTYDELQDLENKCANQCKYLNNGVLLPAALMAPNLGNGEHQYISCSRMTDLKNQFAVKYPGVSAGSSLYYILFPNFCNHILGYALSYNDYAVFAEKCTGNAMAVLYNKPASPTIPVDDFQCGRNNIIEVYERAGQAYTLYIAQERQRFRNLYISKCLSTKADATIEGKQYEYHYTLYYYDQSGNLVKTIPPEGVRLLTEEQLKQVENIRKTGNAGCADDGIVKEEDLNATLNTFSSAVQSSSARSLELLLKNIDANTGSQVRFITPDHKFMYQAAIVKDKLWVELYSIQPGSSGDVELVLSNHATANIGTNISQKWSQVVVQSNGFAGSPWDLYFNGKKLDLLPHVSAPAYPFAWEIESGYTLPTDDVTYLKHFRLYSTPLQSAEISENYNNSCLSIANTLQGATSPLIVWGRFESSSLCNPLTETASVPNPGALQINGALGIYQTNLNNVTNNFTVELWVNPQQPINVINQAVTGTQGTNGQGYAIFPTYGVNATDAGMGISVGTNGLSVYEHAGNYMPPLLSWRGSITGWTHIAIVYKNRMPYLYINGRYIDHGLQSTRQNISPSYNFGYGQYGVMQGAIDEVRIWNVIRTDQEISDSYVQGVVPGSSTGLVGYWPMDPANGGVLTDISCSRNDVTLPASNYTWIAEGSNITNIASASDANNFIVPLHGMPTTYAHNSLNQIVKQNSPDGGTTRFWYDRLGKLVVSQNAEQLMPLVQGASSNRYSYNKYDAFDRVVEIGEKLNAGAVLKEETARNNETLQAWMQSGQDGQITQTIYDESPSFAPGLLTNLRKRIAASIVLDGAIGAQRSAATYYSYDYVGNVTTLYQENQKLSQFDAITGIKRIDYEYDLVSGNTNKVKYQEGKGDQFFYSYRYDADNRVVEASTSRDGLIWNTEATYRYYLHGPLARTELGHNKVQGLDVAYNLQGWIKGINSQQLDASKDMAQDGYAGSNFSQVARDVIGFSLGYFENDYKPISSTANAFVMAYQPTPTLPNESGKNLYNGNIGNVTLALSKLDNGALKGYTYRYDQLNRLKQMRFHDLAGVGSDWGNNSIVPGLYQEDISYDGNGNIETYKRAGNNTNNHLMDDLTYQYNLDNAGQKLNNKLRHVHDDVPESRYTTDIDNQQPDYYTFDNIGNLINEGSSNISWTLDKKIKQISNSGQTINYKYDAIGNRIVKIVEKGNTKQFTFYVRDPKGNVLGIYSKNEQTIPSANDKLKWAEQHLYGTRKLGLWHPNIEVTSAWLAPATGNGQINIGEREYELSNHLGNVLATINDSKIGVDEGLNGSIDYFEANVLTTSDYYPFGMQMPGRTYNGGNYRYGFNGKENDNEIKGNGAQQDFGNRAYDTRIAKFLSVDRLSATNPGSSPYNVSADNPILLIDINGDNPGLPSHYIATAVIQKHTTAFMTIFLASNTSVFELYEYAVQGQQHKRRNLVGAVGEAVAYRRLLEDGGGLKSLLPFNHFNQYGPRKVERNTKLFLGRKEDGHQVDVQEVETVFYRKSTYGTRSMSTGIYYHNFEGTERSIKEVHALLGERFEFHVNFEVKALNVTSDVGFLYSKMEYALGQAKLRSQGRHTAAVFITDLAAWQKVANDQTYGPQLKELFKNKGDNVYVRLFEGFYEETNNELEKIKETVIQADKEERERAAKGK